jgi:hypothetical protein
LPNTYCSTAADIRTIPELLGLDEGLEYIARCLENALKELEVRNPEVDTRFKLTDANRFEAMAYVNREEQSRCAIWLARPFKDR